MSSIETHCRSTSFLTPSDGEGAAGAPAASGTRVLSEGQDLAALRESEERLAAAFEQAAVGLAHVAPDGRWLRVNPKLCRIVGYEPQELLALTFQDITHSEDLGGDVERINHLLSGRGQTYTMEKRYVRKDGSLVWVNLTVSLIRSVSGEPKYFLSVVEDITDRKQAEQLRARLAALVESSDDAIFSISLDGVIKTWNAGAGKLFGYEAAEIVGRPIDQLWPPDRRPEEEAILSRIRRGERVDHYETVRLAKGGRPVDVSLSISPIRDESGRVVGVSKIARDVTEWNRSRRELREAKEAAEAANRTKDQFLAVLSHELRTPLAPVLAAATFLCSDPALSQTQREQLEAIRRNVELEARLIDDLLDLTRITRNKVELLSEVLDAHEAVRNTLEIVRGKMDEKTLEVSLELNAARHHVRADPARVRQILWNLLNNAVKFTPPGGRVVVRTRNAEADRLVFEICDTGVGIEPDVLPRIFDAFEQGERTVTRRFGGLGLGLTISRALAEMQGGTLAASSPGAGRGANFTLDFPSLAAADVPAPEPAPSAPAPPRPKALQVLLVEDHLDTLQILTRLLRSLGCAVKTAESVQGALEAASAADFDLLISDMGLPDGSGLDVMRRIKADKNDRAPRGIALTGFGTENDVRKSREAGFETHLTKPVDFQTLQAVIERVSCE